MKLFFFIILSVFLVNVSFSQEGHYFKFMLKPAKSYMLNYSQKIHSETKYTGDTAFTNKLKEKGIKSFTATNDDMIVKNLMTTSEIYNDTCFNVILNFQKATGNSDTVLISPGSKIFGHCKLNGLPVIDSVTVNKAIKTNNSDIIDVFANSILHIDFPLFKMKVGDVFYNSLPLQESATGHDPIRVTIGTGYKLVKINKQVAVFEIKQVFKMSLGNNKLPGKVSGEGNGILVYDMKENFYKSYELDATMNYSVSYKHYTAETQTTTKVKHETMITKK